MALLSTMATTALEAMIAVGLAVGWTYCHQKYMAKAISSDRMIAMLMMIHVSQRRRRLTVLGLDSCRLAG